MSIVARTTNDPRVRSVEVTHERITMYLADGRWISIPLNWSWRLEQATPQQRAHYEIIGDGDGVHWPDIDEDLSVRGMLHGVPAPRPTKR